MLSPSLLRIFIGTPRHISVVSPRFPTCNRRLSKGDAAVIGGGQAVGEYLQTLVYEASIYHFTQKAILKNTARQDNPVKPRISGNAAADFYGRQGYGCVETP